MMFRLAILILFIGANLLSFANPDFEAGNKAFKAKDYETAVTFYEAEIAQNPENISAYFNLGLSYNSMKKYGKAIWSFEKVLKLSPNDGEAIENIEQNFVELNNDQKWFSEIGHLNRSLFSYGSDFWAILAIVFSILTGISVVFMRRSQLLNRKRLLFISAALTLFLMLFSIYASASAHEFETTHEYAIITKDKVNTFDTADPDVTDVNDIQLPEGMKVRIINAKKNFRVEVELTNGTKTFVSTEDIDII